MDTKDKVEPGRYKFTMVFNHPVGMYQGLRTGDVVEVVGLCECVNQGNSKSFPECRICTGKIRYKNTKDSIGNGCFVFKGKRELEFVENFIQEPEKPQMRLIELDDCA